MKHFLYQFCQRLLLLVLFCVGVQNAYASANDRFKDDKNFTVSNKDNKCLHFHLLAVSRIGNNCWLYGRSPISVTVYNKNGAELFTKEILEYDSWEDSDKARINMKEGAMISTNANTNFVKEEKNSDFDFNKKADGDDEVFIDFDWYPPYEWIKDGNTLGVSIHIYWKEWGFFSDTKRDREINYQGNKIDLSSTIPTFTISDLHFLKDKEQAKLGNVWSIDYSASSNLLGYTVVNYDNKYVTSSKSYETLYYKAQDTTHKNVYFSARFSREDRFFLPENKYWTIETPHFDMPAYHQIKSFLYNSSLGKIVWNFSDADKTDACRDDAFILQRSKSHDFSQVETVATIPFSFGANEYISDVCISIYKDKLSHYVEKDINTGTGGAEVYLNYNTSKNINDAITGVIIVHGTESSLQKSYIIDGKTYTQSGTSLNAGNSGSRAMYLYYTKDKDVTGTTPLVVGLDVILSNVKASSTDDYLGCYEPSSGVIAPNQNCNQGAPGTTFSYIKVTKSYPISVLGTSFEYIPTTTEPYAYRIQRASTLDLGWTHTFALDCNMNNFIKDVCISTSHNSTLAIRSLEEDGYIVLNKDLNYGVTGQYVYLGYKTTTNPSDAISRLKIMSGSNYSCEKQTTFRDGNYEMHPVKTIGNSGGNLNEGTNGEELYLYYSKDNNVGADKTIISGFAATNTYKSLPKPYKYLGTTDYPAKESEATNLNQGCSPAAPLYIAVSEHTHTSGYSEVDADSMIYVGHDCCGTYVPKRGGSMLMTISNAEELYTFASLVNNSGKKKLNAKLVADIVVNENVLENGNLNSNANTVRKFDKWTPIHDYSGLFDGNGYTISGLYCIEDEYAGFFNNTESTAIRNLSIKDSYMKARILVGGIIGRAVDTDISSCSYEGVLSGTILVGGITGNFVTQAPNSLHILKDCYAKGNFYVKDNNFEVLGGAGISYQMSADWNRQDEVNKTLRIENCYSIINKADTHRSSGIVGEVKAFLASPSDKYIFIDNCYSNCETLIGTKENYTLTNSASYDDVVFGSGKVAYLLNGEAGGMKWYQIIGTDEGPAFFDADHPHNLATVYKVRGYSCVDENKSMTTDSYSNDPYATPLLVHEKPMHHPYEAPTCGEDGYAEFWYCETCQKVFFDSNYTVELMKIPVIATTQQHEYDIFDVCIHCGKSKGYKNPIAELFTSIHAVEEECTPSEVYDLQGRKIQMMKQGLNIVRDSNGKTYKVIKK